MAFENSPLPAAPSELTPRGEQVPLEDGVASGDNDPESSLEYNRLGVEQNESAVDRFLSLKRPWNHSEARRLNLQAYSETERNPIPATEIPTWTVPEKTFFQSFKLRDVDYSEHRFPDNRSCPFMGIRHLEGGAPPEEIPCTTHKPSEAECRKSFKAYGLHKKPPVCRKPKTQQRELCWILDSWRPDVDHKLSVQCDISQCGKNPAVVSGIDPDVGTIQPRSTFQFANAWQLQEFLPSFIVTNTRYGLNFCYLGCKKPPNRVSFTQLLKFPPILRYSMESERLLNFNFLVLDSVSRAHFYRSLPQTVTTLREIVHNGSLNATAFDFELLQSTAPYTFHNIRVFMSGKSAFDYAEHVNGSYGIPFLFENLKRRGYYTMLQEDSCWYDEWGSILTNNVFQKNIPKTTQEFRQRWYEFQTNIRDYYIDDFGLTHSSCQIFNQHGSTNQFNRPQRICFGGAPFAEQFLKYSSSMFRGYLDSGKRQPIFSYTHINAGHEISGKRIRQMDEALSTYLRNMASVEDTITLIFSDHGPKTTDYSFKTMEGRAEIYDSLLFAIVPESVADFLGAERMYALATNQKRLLTTKELHSSIMSIINPRDEKSPSQAGLFAVVSANRTCANISMKITAVCKCGTWEKRFPDNDPQFLWLAEFALGYLNNLIQEKHANNTKKKGGFGNCQRLVGFEFQKIRRRTSSDNYLITMDLITNPRKEIFEVQATYPIQPRGRRDDVRVTSQRRVSIYRRYEKCVDATVPVELCVCDSKGYGRKLSKKNDWQWFRLEQGSDVLTSITRMRHYGAKTTVKNLHGTCLLLLTRKHSSKTSVAYEIANGCGDRRYSVRLNGRSKGRAITSRKLPISAILMPRTIHFLFSVHFLDEPYLFTLKTSVVVYHK